MIEIYKDRVIPLANIITPNLFELEYVFFVIFSNTIIFRELNLKLESVQILDPVIITFDSNHLITISFIFNRLIYGKKITKESDIFKALNHCHSKGTPVVIVSSSKSFSEQNSKSLCLYASSKGKSQKLNLSTNNSISNEIILHPKQTVTI